MNKQIHPNYIKSSNYIYGTAILGLLNLCINAPLELDEPSIIILCGTFLSIIGLASLIRQGWGWVKYLLLILTLLSIVFSIRTFYNIFDNLKMEIIPLVQLFLQASATRLLFDVPRRNTNLSNQHFSTHSNSPNSNPAAGYQGGYSGGHNNPYPSNSNNSYQSNSGEYQSGDLYN